VPQNIYNEGGKKVAIYRVELTRTNNNMCFAGKLVSQQ